MAMTLPIVIPTSPAGNSPVSDDSNPPVSPSQQPAVEQSNKRKPSRRANTAERRATHNAVERQRRETLNGRFLDLAALLPNLSQIRRPSKSSIVNSSIAHIHASRRHRMLASRELRLVKMEADALRRELNEWRDRAGIPRVEEPVRGEGFSMVLSGELEVIVINGASAEDDEEDFSGAYGAGGSYEDEQEEYHEEPRMMAKNANPFAHNVPTSTSPATAATSGSSSVHLTHIMPRPTISISQHSSGMIGGPMIASPTAMSFENPAMGQVYSEPHVGSYPGNLAFNGGNHMGMANMSMSMVDPEKVAAWNMSMYQQQQQQMMQQRQGSLSSHGPSPPSSSAGLSSPVNPDQAFLAASLARQGRERSASINSGYSGGSPLHGSSLPLSSASSSGSASPSHSFEGPYESNAPWMQPNMVNVTGGGSSSMANFAIMM